MASGSTARAPDGGLLFYYTAGNLRMAPRPATRGPGRLSRGWVSSAFYFQEGGTVYLPPRSTHSRLLTAVMAEGLPGHLRTRSYQTGKMSLNIALHLPDKNSKR